MPDQMPPPKAPPPPQSPESGVAELVASVGEGLAKLTEVLQGVSPDAGARMADVANAFMETVSSLQGGEEPEPPAAEEKAPMRGPAPQMGGPKGVPVG